MKLSKLFATLSAGFVLATGAGLPAAQAATTLNMSSWVSPTHFLTPEVFCADRTGPELDGRLRSRREMPH